MNFIHILIFAISLPLAISFAVVVYNFLFALRIMRRKPVTTDGPLISVLIPARNEESNIAACVDSVLKQSYRNIEVIILDDNSSDGTSQIVFQKFSGNKNVKLLKGGTLPEGWLGKNHSCHQLAGNARGEYLLFIDADVRLGGDAVAIALSVILEKSVSLLSVFPTQKMNNFGEKLVVPLMNWLLLSFLPLPMVYRSSAKSFSAANGQFMFFQRNAYVKTGGHEKVKDKVVEDMELARGVKKSGMKMITGLGADQVFCGMYPSFGEAYRGFSKNFFPGFGIPAAAFFLLILTLLILFAAPFAAVFYHPAFIVPVLLILLSRVLISVMSRQDTILNVILHVPQMIVMVAVGLSSVAAARRGTATWKGRRI